MKTYDYINRVVIMLPLNGLRGYVDNTLPSRCYAITMILRVHRNFFEITTFPNTLLLPISTLERERETTTPLEAKTSEVPE